MAFASSSRLTSSFDWQTALPQGQSNLPPSILVMSDSRQVLTMSQETSSPCGSLVARMSQILILQALRALLLRAFLLRQLGLGIALCWRRLKEGLSLAGAPASSAAQPDPKPRR